MAGAVGNPGPLAAVREVETYIGATSVDIDGEPLSIVVELPAEISDDIVDIIGRSYGRGIGGDHQVGAPFEIGVKGEGEVHALGEVIARQVNNSWFIVVDFDPFEIGITVGGLQVSRRVVHDLGDNDCRCRLSVQKSHEEKESGKGSSAAR